MRSKALTPSQDGLRMIPHSSISLSTISTTAFMRWNLPWRSDSRRISLSPGATNDSGPSGAAPPSFELSSLFDA
jgi:hypothetical protein